MRRPPVLRTQFEKMVEDSVTQRPPNLYSGEFIFTKKWFSPEAAFLLSSEMKC